MTSDRLVEKAGSYLQRLCVDIPSRRVGCEGNRAATDLFARIVPSFAFRAESPEFDSFDWSKEGARLTVDRISFEVFVSPCSPGCHVRTSLVAVSMVEEIEDGVDR